MTNTEKTNEEMLDLSKIGIDELEKQLGAVYDSFVNIDTMVKCTISNIENMSKTFVKMSNINMADSDLDLSLQSMTQNVDALVKSVGCLKSDFEEISELYISTFNSISSVEDSSKQEDSSQATSDISGITNFMNFINEELAGILFEEMVTKAIKKISNPGNISSTVKKSGMKIVLGWLAGMEKVMKGFSPIIDIASYWGENLGALVKGLPKGQLTLATVASLITGYYGIRRGEELEDLIKNIEQLGEEEGRAAAGTSFMDRQALFQYDKQNANRKILEAFWFGENNEAEETPLQKSNRENMLGGATLGMISPFILNEEMYSTICRNIVEGITETEEKEGINQWWVENVIPYFSLETWQELGNNIQTALSTKWEEFVEWWTEKVTPFFSFETWQELGNNIQTALSTTWEGFVEWWKTTGLYKWWTENVTPFFSEETWNFDGIKKGLSKAWQSAVEEIKLLWNQFANWLNDVLKIEFGEVELPNGKKIEAFEIQLGTIPVFEIGGFPEDGLFMANHGELVGKFNNGKNVVANNEQIVSGIKLGVREAVSETLAPYLEAIAMNTRKTADKDFSTYIGDKEIARASERGRRAMGLQLITEI